MSIETQNSKFDFTVVPTCEDQAILIRVDGSVEAAGTMSAMVDMAFEFAAGLELPF